MWDATDLFCDIDDFAQVFLPTWERDLLENTRIPRTRQRKFVMSPAEVMTLLILFHRTQCRNLKVFYTKHVPKSLGDQFPHRVSYSRFVELMQSVLTPLCAYLQTRRVTSRGIAFVDATPLKVCHNRRIPRHKTFEGIAERGKSSMDWFYGFKLHIIIDDCGELVAFFISAGNMDDRKALCRMAKWVKGKLFGDKGYVSKELRETLWEQGIELISKVRRNMKPLPISDFDKVLLRKRSLIETVNDQLKNISQIEHSRHRSVLGFMVNVICALIAYTYQEKKPSLNLRELQGNALVVVDQDNLAYA